MAMSEPSPSAFHCIKRFIFVYIVEQQMRARVILTFSLLYCCSAIAQTDPAGIWQGKLDVGGGQKLLIQFNITKQPNGTFAAILNSPDSGNIKNVSANSVGFKDGKLTLKVDSLNGSYSGTLAKGVLTGEWKQEGKSIPLALTQYKPINAQGMKRLLGEWVAKIKQNDGTVVTVVYHFTMGKDGKFSATSDSPDVGVFGSAVTDISLDGNKLKYRIPDAGDFEGEITAKGISGNFTGQYYTGPLSLVRGKYQPAAAKIDIPPAEMKKLLGRWTGQISGISISFTFERTTAGKDSISMDIPQQNAKAVPVLSASLTDGNLSLKVATMEYSGKVSGDKIEGSLKPANQNSIPLQLTKEKSAPKASAKK
jgi:hypothetical protein